MSCGNLQSQALGTEAAAAFRVLFPAHSATKLQGFSFYSAVYQLPAPRMRLLLPGFRCFQNRHAPPEASPLPGEGICLAEAAGVGITGRCGSSRVRCCAQSASCACTRADSGTSRARRESTACWPRSGRAASARKALRAMSLVTARAALSPRGRNKTSP